MNNYDEYKLNDDKHWEWHTTFIGQYMQHNYRLYYMLDKVFELNPQIENIFELGTGNGALTTYLALWGIKKNIPVSTLDINQNYDVNFLNNLKVKTLIGDEFDANCQDNIRINYIKDKPTMFVCDGSAKEKEFNYYGNLLISQSVIMAHDLNVEFQTNNISPILKTKLEPILQDKWMELNTQMAVYKVI